jgi:hypothetical protein
MVFLPDDGTTVKADGIGNSGVADMGGGKTRFFRATSVAAGTSVKLNLSGITARAHAATAPGTMVPAANVAKASSSAQTAKLVAGVGGLGIFVVGGMLLVFKAPKSKKA